MGLELLREADMVLNACGRPVPPPGFKFVDLPRALGFFGTMTSGEGLAVTTPFQNRVQNTSNTLFLCKGLSVSGTAGSELQFRVKWPSGRFLAQSLSGNNGASGPCFPNGAGATQIALMAPEPIESGGRIAIEITNPPVGGINIVFWGVLRYLLEDTGGADAAVQCVVGYPTEARDVTSRRGFQVQTIPDPVDELRGRNRYPCGPNTNIMAPEFLLGNQCADETPAGYEDEPFSLFSPPITVPNGRTVYGTSVLIHGNEDVVLKRLRAKSVWVGDDTGGSPTFSLRLPNGYSMTGGDLIPLGGLNVGTQFTGFFEWMTIFPTIVVKAGDRIILDMGDLNPAGGLTSITTIFEFDCVKRRKLNL